MDISFEEFSRYAQITPLERRNAIQLTTGKDITHQISHFKVSETDKSWSLGKRSENDINANNKIRTLFLEAIQKKTGLSINELPEAVKKVLELGDYQLGNGKATSGKPLTAYRIRQVATALQQHETEISNLLSAKAQQAVPAQPAQQQSQLGIPGYTASLDKMLNQFKLLETTISANSTSNAQSAMMWGSQYIHELVRIARKLSDGTTNNLDGINEEFNKQLEKIMDFLQNGRKIQLRLDPANPSPSQIVSKFDDATTEQVTTIVSNIVKSFRQQTASIRLQQEEQRKQQP